MATGWPWEYVAKMPLSRLRAFHEYWSTICPAPHVMLRVLAQLKGWTMPTKAEEFDVAELAAVPGVWINPEPIIVKVETMIIEGPSE